MTKVRQYIEKQTIVYNVLMALEAEKKQAVIIKAYLEKFGESFTVRQVRSALQRLRKEGLAKYDGCWHRASK